MQTEIEAKFLDIKPDSLRAALKKSKAVRAHPERLMKRKTLDYPDKKLHKTGGWVRVRDEGDRITLAYKRLADRTINGTKEISVIVDDFDAACNVLEAIGLCCKSYQETKRERWMLNGVEITIDTWPWIPAFVELEGESEAQLKDVARILGLDWTKALHGSVETAYQAYYNVTEEEIDNWERIVFIPVPDWLEKRKKRKIE